MLRIIDAAWIDSLSPAFVATFDLVNVYGSAFGSTQGPWRRTPDSFRPGKPTMSTYFPGADPVRANAEATARGSVLIVCDIEKAHETDPWTLATSAVFGSRVTLPSVIYSHDVTCAKLAPHFTRQWLAGERKPSSLPPRTAIQWEYAGGYDESAASDDFIPGTFTPVGGSLVGAQISDAIGLYPTPLADGYYIVESNGGLWPFGPGAHVCTDGGGHPNMVGALAPGRRIVGFAVHAAPGGTVDGYWFAQDDGGVFPFGAAPGFGAVP